MRTPARWRRIARRLLGGVAPVALAFACGELPRDAATVAVAAGSARGAGGSAEGRPRGDAATAPLSHDTLHPALARRVGGDAPAGVSAVAWRQTRALYASEDSTPLWLDALGVGADAATLIDAVARAHEHALRRSDYPLREVEEALAAVSAGRASADAWARADVALTTLLVAYADDLLTGRVRPRDIESAWHIEPRAVDVDSALRRTVRAARFDEALARLVPREDGYATLVDALARYRTIVERGAWRAIPDVGVLRPGDSTPHAAALQARLIAQGLLDGGTKAGGDGQYAGALVAAIARFQARHGLAVDSVLGPRTRRALNVPVERRARQIAASLERYRWLPRVLGTRYVVVNVPAFRLEAFEGDSLALAMRVVVGSELADRRTPIFSDSMSYIQFGPYWNVPRRIAVNEILPHARRDRGYLARNDYEIVRGWGANAPVVDPWALSDTALFSPRYRVRQRPGPQNALGRVKFMFPNEFAVYLHDTPARARFDERVRAYSHGCVRVADPEALARWVLAGRDAWDDDRIAATLREGRRVRVDLREKIPVYLIYLTAFARDGDVAFREDLYDLDGPLLRALGDSPEQPETDGAVARLRRLVGGAAAR